MIKDILEKLIKGEKLTRKEAYKTMDMIMAGEVNDVQIAAYLTALRCKGESEEEIIGSCLAIREHSKRVPYHHSLMVDTCGTGGDGRGTFNISSVSALVVAGAGVPVAKHGNRAVSGKCGSADLWESLGVNVEMPPAEAASCLDRSKIAFLFAPIMHPAMARAVPARKSLGVRTVFNILGPLNNPAEVKKQVIGVFDAQLTEKMAGVLSSLGAECALVVHGLDGTDEISLAGETRVTELRHGTLKSFTISPEDYGLSRVPLEYLRGGDESTNAAICLSILQGERGPRRDVVLLNAGAAIYVSGKAHDLHEGINLASESIDSGAALEVLKSLRQQTQIS